MASSNAGTVLPASDSLTDRAVQETNLCLRFLRTTNCPAVGCYPLLSIDHEMEKARINAISNHQGGAETFISKAISKSHLIWNLRRSDKGPVFVGLMGLTESCTFPFSYWTEIVPFCFDCWPNHYRRWTAFFKRHRVRIAFFSARQSAQYFSNALPAMKSVWLPEATSPSEYYPSIPWSQRNIDVLELGRRNDIFHDSIVQQLAQANKSHLFERKKGEIVFPDRTTFIKGLARSKISVCFPCSQTHPERSGDVETVTHRYFESMASKCLIMGHAPQELIDLFGYNPIIEADRGHEFEQIESLLNGSDATERLIERNYMRLLEVGTWEIRVAEILNILAKFPF